jgi:hypothetical protein
MHYPVYAGQDDISSRSTPAERRRFAANAAKNAPSPARPWRRSAPLPGVWSAIRKRCGRAIREISREVLAAAAVAPSSNVVVGRTGYGELAEALKPTWTKLKAERRAPGCAGLRGRR